MAGVPSALRLSRGAAQGSVQARMQEAAWAHRCCCFLAGQQLALSADCMLQAPRGERAFLKGLAVVDDIAYFGIAPHAVRNARADPALDCALAAFSLLSQQLLWRRKVWL